MIGEKEVSFSVGSFGSTTYNQANIIQLEAYISNLKSQLVVVEGNLSEKEKQLRFHFNF